MGAQQYPGLAVGLGQQRAAGGVQLYGGRTRLAALDAGRQAQPVVLAGHQAHPGERVIETLHPLFDKGLGVVDQRLAVGA
ncbi:hypothetical protein D3C77_319670 [compost metagenome]